MTSAPAATRQHTIVVQLNDRPGALYRAIGLIRRRDFNVSRLVVGATDDSGTSRMVLVVEAADVRQVVQQLSRLIDVLSVVESPHEDMPFDQFVEVMRRFDFPQGTSTPLATTQELVR